MPILEFALDASALSRVQVHINTHQGPVSVMLNRNAIGSLTTLEEQTSGKDFHLPDSSILRVQILNGHPQAWRNGRPLLLASVPEPLPVVDEEPRGRMGGGVTALFILNLLVIGGLCIWFFVAALLGIPMSKMVLPFLLSSLLALVGLAGVFALLAWKRWGFYLAVCYAIANFALAITSGIIDYRTFIPLAALALLFLALNSSGIWHKMK